MPRRLVGEAATAPAAGTRHPGSAATILSLSLRRLTLSFGLKSARAIRRGRRPSPSCDQPVHGGADQGVIADVIELRLHLLPVVRGHQRELLVQPADDAAACALPARAPCRRAASSRALAEADRDLDQLAVRVRSRSINGTGLVRADAGAAHEVGGREAAEAAEPGDRQRPLLARRRSKRLDPLEHFEVPAADLPGRRLQAPGRRRASSPPTTRGRRTAGPRPPSPALRGTICARPHSPGSTVSQSSSDTVPMISAVPMWKRTGTRCLIGRRASSAAVQPDGQRPRRQQVARRRQLLAADDVLVADAGQVDRRPHAAMDLLDRPVVILQRPHPHPLAARQPFQLVADAHAART